MGESTPILRRLLLALVRAFKSRRVLMALSALVVGLLILAVPELEAVRDELLTLVISLVLMLVGGYSLHDAARAGRERASTQPETMPDLIKDVLDGVVDEITIQDVIDETTAELTLEKE